MISKDKLIIASIDIEASDSVPIKYTYEQFETDWKNDNEAKN